LVSNGQRKSEAMSLIRFLIKSTQVFIKTWCALTPSSKPFLILKPPKPFRDRDDNLPVRYFSHNLVPDKLPELLHLLLVATRAEIALLATEGNQVVVSAMITMQAGAAATQVAADLEGVQRLGYRRA